MAGRRIDIADPGCRSQNTGPTGNYPRRITESHRGEKGGGPRALGRRNAAELRYDEVVGFLAEEASHDQRLRRGAGDTATLWSGWATRSPATAGFQDRELRRDVDRMLREHLAAELGRLKGLCADRARGYTDAGKIGVLHGFDRLDRQIDGLSQAIRFSRLRGERAVRSGEDRRAELERLYQFDLSVVDDLAQIESEIAALPAPGGDDPAPALDRLLQGVRGAGRQVAAARAGDQQRAGRAAQARRRRGA